MRFCRVERVGASHPLFFLRNHEDRAQLETPEAVFSRELFLRNPLPCLEMKRDFVLSVQAGAYVPTLFHRLVKVVVSWWLACAEPVSAPQSDPAPDEGCDLADTTIAATQCAKAAVSSIT